MSQAEKLALADEVFAKQPNLPLREEHPGESSDYLAVTTRP